MIACKTIIGFGAPNKQGTHNVHGAPLGAEEIAAARKQLNWDSEPFVVPDDILDAWRAAGTRSAKARSDWEARLAAADTVKKSEFTRRFAGKLPEGFDAASLPTSRSWPTKSRRSPPARHRKTHSKSSTASSPKRSAAPPT